MGATLYIGKYHDISSKGRVALAARLINFYGYNSKGKPLKNGDGFKLDLSDAIDLLDEIQILQCQDYNELVSGANPFLTDNLLEYFEDKEYFEEVLGDISTIIENELFVCIRNKKKRLKFKWG